MDLCVQSRTARNPQRNPASETNQSTNHHPHLFQTRALVTLQGGTHLLDLVFLIGNSK